MSKHVSHEEIAQRFVDAKAFDFNAMGKLVAELAPTLAVGDQGLHGVIFGRFNCIACCIPAYDVANLVGSLRQGGLAAAMGEAPSK